MPSKAKVALPVIQIWFAFWSHMFGRDIGAVEGYTYSKAVQDSDIV